MEERDAERIRNMLEAAYDTASKFSFRWLIGRYKDLTESKKMDAERLDSVIDEVMTRELERSLILKRLEQGTMTVVELSEVTGLRPRRVVSHLISMRKSGLVRESGERNGWYLYEKV